MKEGTVYCLRGERTAACRANWWRECHYVGSDLWAGEDTTGHHYGNVTAQCYIDDILCLTVQPFLKQQPCGVIYQHVNVRPHTARITQHCMLARHVRNRTPTGCHGSCCSTASTTNKNWFRSSKENGYVFHVTSSVHHY